MIFFYSWQWYGGPCSEVEPSESNFEKWNWGVFGDIALNITKTNDKVMAIQETIRTEGFFDVLFQIDFDALADLDRVLGQQEVFLRENSIVRWLVEGIRISTSFTLYLHA